MKFFKTVISIFVILFPLISNSVTLPDFTELAENQGKTVVNITSIKNTMIQPGNTHHRFRMMNIYKSFLSDSEYRVFLGGFLQMEIRRRKSKS